MISEYSWVKNFIIIQDASFYSTFSTKELLETFKPILLGSMYVLNLKMVTFSRPTGNKTN
jgi:hypothetical protein